MKTGVVKIRVIYADTDAMGIVYHTNYIRWFEIGRTELLRQTGVVYSEMEKEGYFLPLTELDCHYLYPARYDDVVLVETRIEYFRRASVAARRAGQHRLRGVLPGLTACSRYHSRKCRSPLFRNALQDLPARQITIYGGMRRARTIPDRNRSACVTDPQLPSRPGKSGSSRGPWHSQNSRRPVPGSSSWLSG